MIRVTTCHVAGTGFAFLRPIGSTSHAPEKEGQWRQVIGVRNTRTHQV